MSIARTAQFEFKKAVHPWTKHGDAQRVLALEYILSTILMESWQSIKVVEQFEYQIAGHQPRLELLRHIIP